MQISPRMALLSVPVVMAFHACCERIGTAVDARVTITQGLFGQIIMGTDNPVCWYSYGEGEVVAIFTQAPRRDGTDVPQQTLNVGEQGFFQSQLPPGRYFLCMGGRGAGNTYMIEDCTPQLELTAGQTQRHDWKAGDNGGWT